MKLRWLKRVLFVPFLRWRANRLCRDFAPSLHDSARLLDLGCGDMVITRHLAQLLPEAEVVGVDVLDNNLTELSPRLYSGQRLPYADNYFDTTCVVFVLHHCQDIAPVLAEVHRVTSRRVIIVEEVLTGLFNRLLTYLVDWVANRLESFSVAVPLNFRSDESWKQMFEASGFRLVSEGRLYQFPGWVLTHQKLYSLELKGRPERTAALASATAVARRSSSNEPVPCVP